MSSKYKFVDKEGTYFVTSTVVGWVDAFTRDIYRDILLDSFRFLPEESGITYSCMGIDAKPHLAPVYVTAVLKQKGEIGGPEPTKLTYEAATSLYRFGGGRSIHVNLNTIDLSGVSLDGIPPNGFLLAKLAGTNFSNLTDALVHGTLKLQRLGNTNQVQVRFRPEYGGRAEMYDFDQKWNNPLNMPRNFLTGIAWFMANIQNNTYYGGTPYLIYYDGTATINETKK